MASRQKISDRILAVAARLWRRLRGTEWKTHPIDTLYGIETSLRISRRELRTGTWLDAVNVGYAGMQPSVLQACLDLFPINPDWAFVDLGCGKGRALAVAAQYPFGRLAGIELVVPLWEIAQSNAAIMAARRPTPPMDILLGDATQFDIPPCGTVILFLYNPFGKAPVEQVVSQIEKHLAARPGLKIFVVYYNPVHHLCFDQCPSLSRMFARKIQITEAELAASALSVYDSVVIYQSNNTGMMPVHPGADAAIKITIPDFGADIVS